MADSQASNSPSSPHHRGGRRRGRGAAHQSGQAESQQPLGDNSGRGQRSGGRGGRGRGQNRNANKARTNVNLAPEASGQASSGTAAGGGESKPKQTAVTVSEDADAGEICFICASNVEHTSISPCNHRTCHICALRLRALYKNKACAHCRVSYNMITPHYLANAFLDRRNPTLLSLRTIMGNASRCSRMRTILGRMTILASNMRKMRSSRIQSCYYDTIALMMSAM